MTNGESKWLPLAEAFERFADPEAREEYESASAAHAKIPRPGRDLPRYWDNTRAWRDAEPERRRASHAPGEARAKVSRSREKLRRSFVARLSAGELVGRAREASPLGPWREVPADAWTALRVESWKTGRLTVPGTDYRLFSAEVAACPMPRGPAEPDTRPIAGPAAASVADPRHERRAFSEAEVRRWYTQEWIPRHSADGRPPSRDEDLAAALEIFPEVSRTFLRRLRQEFGPAEWQRSGRPRKMKQPRLEPGS